MAPTMCSTIRHLGFDSALRDPFCDMIFRSTAQENIIGQFDSINNPKLNVYSVDPKIKLTRLARPIDRFFLLLSAGRNVYTFRGKFYKQLPAVNVTNKRFRWKILADSNERRGRSD